jgi:hypothetical protein
MKLIAQSSFLKRVHGFLLLIVLTLAGWLATVAPNPPAPVLADAPADKFSAGRALVHVRSIAQTAHPIGSQANAAARDYISAQLTKLGLKPEVQSFPYRNRDPDGIGVNLMARISGARNATKPASAVAVVCHHDSVPTGPGASDDGSAVGALLETARALKAGPVLQNDVILLFTDGEEAVGLLGAEAFAAGHAWMKDIGFVLNFEARGISGPVFMFETGPGNGRAISEFAQAAPRPVANSLMYEVYRRMPNDTDFTIFKRAGLSGLNFAFIGEPRHYHAPTDDLAHLDLRCLQHQGSYALSLARHFGNLNLAKLNGADAVYFDLLGRVLVHYPCAWALPLALLAAALFVGVALLEIKRREVSLGQLGFGWLAFAANLLTIGTIFGFHPDLGGLSRSAPAWFERFFWGLPCWFASVGLTVAICATLHLILRRWIAPASLALGALLWWLLLGIASAVWMPGASYVLLWPLLFGLVGVVATSRVAESPWRRFAWLAVSALPTIILVAPLVQGIYVALGPNVLFVPTLVLALGLGALSLQLEAISRTWTWTLPLAGVLVAVVVVFW